MARLGYRIARMNNPRASGNRRHPCPQPSRFPPPAARAARTLAWGWSALIVVALLSPALPGLSFLPWNRGLFEQPSYLDKLIHAVLFLVETRLLARPGALAVRAGMARGRLRAAVSVAAVLGASTEALQGPIPTRSADWGDLLANLVGIACGAWWAWRAMRRSVGAPEQTR